MATPNGLPDEETVRQHQEIGGLGPTLTGPITICGAGMPESGGHRRRCNFVRTEKVGEDGYIFIMYLDKAVIDSINQHADDDPESTVTFAFPVSGSLR